MTDLFRLSAVEVVRQLRRGALFPEDLIDAALARIGAVDGAVNALPTLCADRARHRAGELAGGRLPVEPDAPGWLAGLPVVIKDMNPVSGVRTTFGSPIYADHVPTRSDMMVSTLERRGGVVLAKSNTPEWAAGAHTFNEVFGATRNPWNTALSCGGSSGGSAVALATGMAWLATGSDLGGSLRIPAAFNNVVGLRPSPGRVPQGPLPDPFNPLSVEGPMARTVADCALLLDAMSGPAEGDPLSADLPPGGTFLDAALRPETPARVGFSGSLGVDPVTRSQIDAAQAAALRFGDLGSVVEDAGLDLSDAIECFQTLRALYFATSMHRILERHRALLKPEVVWNIEKGLSLTGTEIARAQFVRSRIVQRMTRFFERFDLLATPATAVPPFPLEQRTVEEIEGQKLNTYIDWLALTFAITLTGCPALSLPCGFTADGLPIGLQLVAPPRKEGRLLAYAAALEGLLDLKTGDPIDPRPPA